MLIKKLLLLFLHFAIFLWFSTLQLYLSTSEDTSTIRNLFVKSLFGIVFRSDGTEREKKRLGTQAVSGRENGICKVERKKLKLNLTSLHFLF